MMIRSVLGFALLAGFLSCASMRYAGPPQAELDQQLRERAAFDFSCPKEGITLTALTMLDTGITGSQGAEGCGRKAVYVLVARGTKAEWIMNSP